jgi:putative serine protease PepD
MTAGYDPSDPAVRGAEGSGLSGPHPPARHAAADGDYVEAERVIEAERLGPLPPRPGQTGSFPSTGSFSSASPSSASPASPASTGFGGSPSYPATGSFAAQAPTSSYPASSPITVPPMSPYGPPPGSAGSGGRPRGGLLGTIALVAAVLLLVVAVVEGVFIYQLDHKVSATNAAAAKQKSDDDARFEGLESRAKELEKKAGATIDTADVAKAVLPSVFRVSTPQALGTAFALGKADANGGTNLITNYHVVQEHYEGGGRDVSLERSDTKFSATIIKVDKAKDLALLHSDEKFTNLAAATEQPAVGQQVLAIGAPLGLEDSVTAGVVSAFRNTQEGQRMQFDAPINPGNSGGPVVDAQKHVVGIATAKAADAEGIGLAIPIKTACDTFGIC